MNFVGRMPTEIPRPAAENAGRRDDASRKPRCGNETDPIAKPLLIPHIWCNEHVSWLTVLNRDVISCTRCPRLVAYREQVAREKRRAYLGWEYWGKPVPGFGDPEARVLILLPGHARGTLTRYLELLHAPPPQSDGIAGSLTASGTAALVRRYELPQGRRYALLGPPPPS